ncbi:MAG: putative RNA uridine N3 methyltransferase [Promethearchaeota archaeon]
MFSNFPKVFNVGIILPISIFSLKKTLLLKTLMFAQLYRTFNTFKIKEIFFYNDNFNDKDCKFIMDCYQYLRYPPYLRKYIRIKSNLKYIGVAPPIQAPNHLGVKIGNSIFKEGLILNLKKKILHVDIGDKIIKLEVDNSDLFHIKVNDLIIVMNSNRNYQLKNINKTKHFWCSEISIWRESLKKLLVNITKKYNDIYFIGATKYGHKIENIPLKGLFQKEMLYIIFGPPSGKLTNFLMSKKIINDINFLINFIPDQGTKTIRTGEAVIYTISSLYTLYKEYS